MVILEEKLVGTEFTVQSFVDGVTIEHTNAISNAPRVATPTTFLILKQKIDIAKELIKNKRIDHPRVGGKDMADAVANIVWHLRGEEIESVAKPGFNLAKRF